VNARRFWTLNTVTRAVWRDGVRVFVITDTWKLPEPELDALARRVVELLNADEEAKEVQS
jgi:hypothetical protein